MSLKQRFIDFVESHYPPIARLKQKLRDLDERHAAAREDHEQRLLVIEERHKHEAAKLEWGRQAWEQYKRESKRRGMSDGA